MGRKKQTLESDLTVRVVIGKDEAQNERWYRAMALLLSAKFDPESDTPTQAAPPSEAEQLSTRLDMACGK